MATNQNTLKKSEERVRQFKGELDWPFEATRMKEDMSNIAL